MSRYLPLSNNAYFGVNFISLMHFGESRIRAVENRRDIAVNANYGIIGRIVDSGKISQRYDNTQPQQFLVGMGSNSYQTFYTRYGDWLIIMCIIALFFKILHIFKILIKIIVS